MPVTFFLHVCVGMPFGGHFRLRGEFGFETRATFPRSIEVDVAGQRLLKPVGYCYSSIVKSHVMDANDTK